jgi:acyl dehydratase
VAFEQEEIINFANRYDPQPFHVNKEIARASIFGGLIASALHTISACTRVVVEAQGDLAIMSGLGIDEVKLFNPVRPGDVLSIEAYWSDLKRSRSKPDRGIANLKCKISNQRGEPVAEYGYKYLVACRDYV